MASATLERVSVRFSLYDAWSRSVKQHLLQMTSAGLVPAGQGRNAEVRALDEVSLPISPGQRVAVLGANGAGKTTLLRVIAGLLAPCEGIARRQGRPFGVFNGGFGFDLTANVADTVFLYGLLYGLRPTQLRSMLGDIASREEYFKLLRTPANRLSLSHQLRLGIAMALGLRADILVIDEVLGGAEPDLAERAIRDLEAHLPDDAVLVVADRPSPLLERLCDTAVLLFRGRVVDHGAYGAVTARDRGRQEP